MLGTEGKWIRKTNEDMGYPFPLRTPFLRNSGKIFYFHKVLKTRKHEIAWASEYLPFRGWLSSTGRFRILPHALKILFIFSTHIYNLQRGRVQKDISSGRNADEKQNTRMDHFSGIHTKGWEEFYSSGLVPTPFTGLEWESLGVQQVLNSVLKSITLVSWMPHLAHVIITFFRRIVIWKTLTIFTLWPFSKQSFFSRE